MTSLSQQVLEKIKNNNLKPKPKWEFLVKEYLIWALAVVSLIVGSMSFAVIIFMTTNDNWDLIDRVKGFWQIMLLSLPYFWILVLAIFISVAYYNFRHTPKGYRYQLSSIFALSILLSIVFGAFFYQLGLGKAMDEIFYRNIPFYRDIHHKQMMIWNLPDQGLIIGEIMSVRDNGDFDMEDLSEKNWRIKIESEKTKIQPGLSLSVGEMIRVFCVDKQDDECRADAIMDFARGIRMHGFGSGIMPPPPPAMIMCGGDSCEMIEN